MRKLRDSEMWKWVRTALEIALIALIIWGIVCLYSSLGFAESEYTEAYVLCEDYVNIRIKPTKKSESIGRFECGEKIWLDGKKRNGYLHCVDLSLESDTGWIHSGFVVYDEPQRMNQSAVIVSKGRLAARKYVNGKRTRWLKPLASLKVYWWSDDWCVTNCGYVQSKYLEPEGE